MGLGLYAFLEFKEERMGDDLHDTAFVAEFKREYAIRFLA